MYKKHYQLFLEANPGIQHYASHSHHYWPDVTRDAMLEYWSDSARWVDDKWNYIFTNKIPRTQKLIADVLNLSHPAQIAFAPNTHEFVGRLLSCFKPGKKIRILTTDSEFYSFDRQINRLIEDQLVEVVKVPTEPFDVFENRFKEHLKAQDWDLVFFSQVFFNSGHAIKDLVGMVNLITNPDTIIAVDGYHAFMAIPTDLKAIENRIFYISGAYKYAQGGEGCCFMTVPKDTQLKPTNTGWFAGFSGLAGKGSEVIYSDDGYRFAGSTMDFTALYRLEASLSLFVSQNITVDKIHRHVQALQKNFLSDISKWTNARFSKALNEKNLLMYDLNHHGHFLTFEVSSNELTKSLHDEFHKAGIRTDYRGSRWRFGFGLYQDNHIDLTKLG
jgi:selenocysteine lyase/cysteine desulfurase